MRYCEQCNIFRPPTRCSHCYTCGHCIYGFDHHCVWLGTCIGGRNYFDFVMFLLSLTGFIMFCEISLIFELTDFDSESNFGSSLGENMHGSLIIPLCFLFLILVGVLLCFHLVIIYKNLTTHEFLKDAYSDRKVNPFVEPRQKLKAIMKHMLKYRNRESLIKPPSFFKLAIYPNNQSSFPQH